MAREEELKFHDQPNITAHSIDWSKVTEVSDLVELFKAMDLTFMDDGSDRFAPVRPYYAIGGGDDGQES